MSEADFGADRLVSKFCPSRDYADVSPIRGIFNGGGRHTRSLGVTMTPRDACILG